jgi:hypothetical protein
MKNIVKELKAFDKYLKKSVREKTGKHKPSNKDYIEFLEELEKSLLQQMNSNIH